jgi:hypothetical protein
MVRSTSAGAPAVHAGVVEQVVAARRRAWLRREADAAIATVGVDTWHRWNVSVDQAVENRWRARQDATSRFQAPSNVLRNAA